MNEPSGHPPCRTLGRSLATLIALCALLLPLASPAAERWYSAEQVEQGKELFARDCASCHGASGQATPNWRTVDASGNYPPPPLNGTAHTWHHPLPVLRRTIREGGARLGGQMPPFKTTLSAEEIDARWDERNRAASGTLQPVATGEQPTGFQLGNQMGVRGTPAIGMPNGRMVQGYRPAAELIAVLGLR